MADDTSANNQPAGYVPPEVWTWNPGNGGQFASINRPVSGSTHEQALPVGEHPLQLYSLGTPNGQKVTIMLEELLAMGHAGAEYDAWLIKIGDGDQFGSGFVDINPNSKIPALMDHSTNPPTRLFESGSILFYIAEKFGAFLPTEHFYAYAPLKIEYAIDRYAMETKRQLHVLDTHLATREFVIGDEYTIADIAIWPWYGAIMTSAYSAQEFLNVAEYEHLARWVEQIASRPAVKRGRRVNTTFGPPEAQLPERHKAGDFAA
jgi:GSH-dependent disulfide-bond oxidoreductase